MTAPTFTPDVLESLFVDLVSLGVTPHLVFVHSEKGTTATEITLELLEELAAGMHLEIFDAVPIETVILAVTGGWVPLDADAERISRLPEEERSAEINERVDAAGDDADLATFALVGDLESRTYLLAVRSTIGIDPAEIHIPSESLEETAARHAPDSFEGSFARFVSLLADRRNPPTPEETP